MGSDRSDSFGSDGGSMEFFPDTLKDRVLYAMVAVAMGIGTGSLLKDDRPDPWTGSMDAARMSHFEAELKEYIELRVKHLETHVTEASDWKVRIRDLEKTCQLNAERVMQMRRGWRLLDQPGDGE